MNGESTSPTAPALAPPKKRRWTRLQKAGLVCAIALLLSFFTILLFSAHDEPVRFALPARTPTQQWERLLDTSDARWGRHVACDATHYELAARAVVVFRLSEPAANGGAA